MKLIHEILCTLTSGGINLNVGDLPSYAMLLELLQLVECCTGIAEVKVQVSFRSFFCSSGIA